MSGASESFVAWLLADLPHLIGGGIVSSMPLSRTQQETADLFQAAGVQESCRTHTPARLTSAQRSAAAVSGAEKLSSRHVLPRVTRGQVNAVRAAFKAGITPSRIARQFGISQSDVRKVLASEFRRAGKGR